MLRLRADRSLEALTSLGPSRMPDLSPIHGHMIYESIMLLLSMTAMSTVSASQNPMFA